MGRESKGVNSGKKGVVYEKNKENKENKTKKKNKSKNKYKK